MASNKNKAKDIGEEKAIDPISQQIELLDSPFKWIKEGIIRINENINYDCEEDIGDHFLINDIIKKIVSLYLLFKSDISNSEQKLNILTYLDDIGSKLINDNSLESCNSYSIKYMKFTVQVAKCYTYDKLGMEEEVHKLFEMIKDIQFEDNLDKSTIYGCMGILCYKYCSRSFQDAIDFLEKALIYNPTSAFFNFMLGKCLRAQRRDNNIRSRPSEKEKECLLKAYEQNKDIRFAMFVAQMYLENDQQKKALDMYFNIYKSKENLNYSIFLRLAMGFMKFNKFKQARVCLDQACLRYADNTMYLHYEGIYYLKTNNIEKAIIFFRQAADLKNFPAAKQYISVMMNNKKDFDCLEYLLLILKDHDNLSDNKKQSLLLDIALLYFEKSDINKAIEYFSNALKINCSNNFLKEHKPVFKQMHNRDGIYRKFYELSRSALKNNIDAANNVRFLELKKICGEKLKMEENSGDEKLEREIKNIYPQNINMEKEQENKLKDSFKQKLDIE